MNLDKVVNLEDINFWLEGQDPSVAYHYSDHQNCLISQFLRYKEVPFSSVGGYTWDDSDEKFHTIPLDVRMVTLSRPWTFGAAANRASFLISMSSRIKLFDY